MTPKSVQIAPRLPAISIPPIVPMIAAVVIVIVMVPIVIPVRLSAIVAPTAPVLVSIGCHNAAAQQCNGSGKQHKNGLHSSLQFCLSLHSGYALGCMSDVGEASSYSEGFSYNEAHA